MSIGYTTIAGVISTIGAISFAVRWMTTHAEVIKRVGKWLSFTGSVIQEAPDTVSAVESGNSNKVMSDLRALISGIKALLYGKKTNNGGEHDNDKTNS